MWVWWYHFHGFVAKLCSIVILCTLDQLSSDSFKRAPLYIIIPGGAAVLLVFIGLYRLFSIMYLRRELNQVYDELWK